ncbi:MAG: hypothetical protein BWY57_02347 [Betaproteobacteria bacterium ADurb.Bin341]|nr:MAG: hypothetical protein BWY57_02347 [Betaproteobacteria bacterium ADurb.Bin341]
MSSASVSISRWRSSRPCSDLSGAKKVTESRLTRSPPGVTSTVPGAKLARRARASANDGTVKTPASQSASAAAMAGSSALTRSIRRPLAAGRLTCPGNSTVSLASGRSCNQSANFEASSVAIAFRCSRSTASTASSQPASTWIRFHSGKALDKPWRCNHSGKSPLCWVRACICSSAARRASAAANCLPIC